MHRSPDPLPEDVLTALQRGDKIEAIKLLRVRRKLDLKDAKDAVDAYLKEYGPQDDSAAPGKTASNGRGLAWLVIACAAGFAAYWLFGR